MIFMGKGIRIRTAAACCTVGGGVGGGEDMVEKSCDTYM